MVSSIKKHNKEKIMIPVQLYTEIIDKGSDITKEYMSYTDPDKFVKQANELTGPQPTYTEIDAQEAIIINSVDMSDLEKLERLRDITAQKEAIRDKELERKQKAGEIVDNHIQKAGNILCKVLFALGTGGWSLAPELYDWCQKRHHKADEQSIIDHSLEG